MDRKWVKNRLLELGKKQSDLAEAVHVARPRITETLAGARSLSARELFGWSDFLEVPVDELRVRLGIDEAQAAEKPGKAA